MLGSKEQPARQRAYLAALVLLAVLLACGAWASLAAADADDPVPWPRGQPPTPKELDEKVSAAIELFELERAEELLEAYEFGEDSEHLFLLQADIDAGKHDIKRLFTVGDSTFEHVFRNLDGYGDRRNAPLRRVHLGTFGGLDAFACADCHDQGGVNGAGSPTTTSFYFGDGERISSAVLRNPPAVLGLGYVQALAREMSAQLQTTRQRALTRAASSQQAVTVALASKGVSFGSVTAMPDGTVDSSALEGVDSDLIVKPFGWKGHTATLRRFGERAARIHFGIQSHPSALEHQDEPDIEKYGSAPKWYDPDGDGVQRELEDGTLTALAIYMALLEVPVIIPPTDPGMRERWARGGELFDRIGCIDCHKRSLPLASASFRERGDTSEHPGMPVDLSRDGEAPRASLDGVVLFSDLKRHDMGAGLADPNDDPEGIGRQLFLTRPLWGLAESAPYLHDGRATTIVEAIIAHDGEASAQRASFEALSDEQQAELHVYLLSLTREPKLRVAR